MTYNPSKVFKNTYNLFFVKALDVFFPILLIPYLINSLTFEGFGVYAFYTAYASFAIVAVNFGFDDTATKYVSENYTTDLYSYICSVVICRLILFISSLSFYTLISILFFDLDILLVMMFVSVSFVEVFNFSFFFQGKQEVGYLSKARVASKFLNFLLILILVDEKSDLWLVPLSMIVSGLVSGIYQIYIILQILGRGRCNELRIFSILVSDHNVFLSNMMLALKDRVAYFLIESHLGVKSVAIYDLIYKFIMIINIPSAILVNAFFPQIVDKEKCAASKRLQTLLLIYVVAVCFMSSSIYLFLSFFLERGEGGEYLPAFYISSFCVVFYTISFYLAKVKIIKLGLYRVLLNTVFISVFFYFLMLSVVVVFELVAINNLVILILSTYLIESLLRLIVSRRHSKCKEL